MKRGALLATVCIAVVAARSVSRPPRELAVTFDDLPGVAVAGAGREGGLAVLQRMTDKLVGVLASERVPVTAFVNEGKLGAEGAADPERVALLRRWRDAGIELGNHTFGHLDFHHVALEPFEADVTRGEPVTRTLLAERGGRLRWFRHPFLHTGIRLEDKRALEDFLASRGYRIAPVTIDNSEWIFAKAYSSALDSGTASLARRIGDAYPPYMEAKLEYFERQSRALFGREVRQVLLVHANSLNADRFEEVLRRIRRRGYRLVSLERALEDPAYATAPDTFTGRGGISWLHRWALSSNRRPLAGEPRTPAFVLDAAGLAEE
ncbi:MAG TPA: polysaccharide deacetylase family protein [Thermoanaerobaculia bacterium]|nr:polysaccharide deacetylase family protein [Thermoanaerobaculia bacterium]